MEQNMKIENMKIKDIYPYQRNAKKHDQVQIDNVAESIRQFGMVQPIVIDKDNNVIIGHCRLLACKKLKMREVPTVKLEDLTPEEANKLRLLDNKLNESEWDMELLEEDVKELNFDGFTLDWGIEIKQEESFTEEQEPDPTDKLPDSRMCVFTISAFGTKSQMFIECKMTEEQSNKLIEKIKNGDTQATKEWLEGIINGL